MKLINEVGELEYDGEILKENNDFKLKNVTKSICFVEGYNFSIKFYRKDSLFMADFMFMKRGFFSSDQTNDLKKVWEQIRPALKRVRKATKYVESIETRVISNLEKMFK